ncbi:hypothetical protein KMZ68_09765 [Bradyrhizobium sediminis]|uniref:Uncharacterized protein n=1 Tax=Bradyrhizobium sediminis TaxID=2840469 RepID=A0A975RTJ5_9BRAD|nr:hypothetical protein [Bradyrhizobium sediminis]QWG20082.1 hypothetical protein KMZ68_09765 [Bradyrhizobium sediminis]
MNQALAQYARRRKNELIAIILIASADASTSQATTLPFEYGAFRSVCTSVEIAADPQVEQEFARATINENVARAIQERLRMLGLTYPVVAGPACLRERATAPQQLGLLFHARVVSDPEHPRRLIVSLIMHSFYNDPKSPGPYHTDIPKAQHEFPTDVSFCSAEADPSRCLTDRVVGYFDVTMLKIIELAQELLKGERR